MTHDESFGATGTEPLQQVQDSQRRLHPYTVAHRVDLSASRPMSAPSTRTLLQVVTSTNRRGAEVFAVSMGQVLGRRGWAVRTIALAPGDIGERLDLPTLGDRPLAPSTVRALRAEARAVAIVAAHGSRTLPASALATLGTDVPFVYRNIGDPRFWASTRLRRLRAGWAMRRARRVVALSPSATDALADHYHIKRELITAIPRAVDIELHRPPRPSIAPRPAGHSDSPPTDQSSRSSVPSRRRRTPSSHSPRSRASTTRTSSSPVTAPSATTGAIGRCDPRARPLPRRGPDPGLCYDAADVVLLTSHSEGLPGVLIEAGLRALPTVTTDVGFVRDIIADAETGFVVASRDPAVLARALQLALDDHDRLGSAARRRCRERFDLESAARQWDELLGSLIVD